MMLSDKYGQIPTIPSLPASSSTIAVCSMLKVRPKEGLSNAEVLRRQETYGRNELPEVPKEPLWKLFLKQFDEGLVKVLLAAAAVSFCMALLESGESLHGFVEPFVVLTILALNAVVGVWQEHRADSAIDALKTFVPKTAVVLRQGQLVTVAAEELVPGDIVELAVGNRVPADMRVVELLSTTLRADQSILNGESIEAMKHADQLSGKISRFPANMVFSGTAIVYGKAKCVVLKTGSSTEIGAIERDVREQEEVRTPLQVKLDEFSDLLTTTISYICIAIFLINVLRWYLDHSDDQYESLWVTILKPMVRSLKIAVSLAVAAIPEGLPAVVTTCLALGTRKMAKHNALVRELPSVETLGRCTVICSDKTGTLTTNMMSVVEIVTCDANPLHLNKYTVEDSKFNIKLGAVSLEQRTGKKLRSSNYLVDDIGLNILTTTALLCNDAHLVLNEKTGQVEKVGEATEAALLTMAEKLGSSDILNVEAVRSSVAKQYTKNKTLEFTRKRKSMSVHCTDDTGAHVLFVKGAPESVLNRCSSVFTEAGAVEPLTQPIRNGILTQLSAMASKGRALRCLGFAFKKCGALSTMDLTDPDHFDQFEQDLVFTGLVGMQDPPRAEVRDAIEKCTSAGIRVVVITGDNQQTAESIGHLIGLFQHGEDVSKLSFTGDEFAAMTDAQKQTCVTSARLFSRTDPSHKMQLVTLLQGQNRIVAMTGDGVNDAPALKKADIGIAMGSGTEVAKAASKMVLADDNFATVVKAVAEGRAIYNNTKQFIRYLISSNIGEVVCVLFTGLVGIPDALESVQLLWVNLVTDGLPATALGFNPPDPDIMSVPPRKLDEKIINGWLFVRYLVIGSYVGLATVGGFVFYFSTQNISFSDLMNLQQFDATALLTARTIALSILVVVEMFNALNALSENLSLVSVRPWSNGWLLLAIASSLLLHWLVLYTPGAAKIFNVVPLGVENSVFQDAAQNAPWSTLLVPSSFVEWKIVLVFSIPVLFVDEALKMVSRFFAST